MLGQNSDKNIQLSFMISVFEKTEKLEKLPKIKYVSVFLLWGKCGQLSLRIKWYFVPNFKILVSIF
jgi:hypothetical protein